MRPFHLPSFKLCLSVTYLPYCCLHIQKFIIFPSQSPLPYTKVKSFPHYCCFLSSQFFKRTKNYITSKCLSLSLGLEKPKHILLSHIVKLSCSYFVVCFLPSFPPSFSFFFFLSYFVFVIFLFILYFITNLRRIFFFTFLRVRICFLLFQNFLFYF